MKLLHLHDKTDIYGGAEVYINQLQMLLPLYGCETFWVGIASLGENYLITEVDTGLIKEVKKTEDVFHFLKLYCEERNIQLINIHNIFNPAIVRFCLQLRPVFKFVHSPVMVCPGKDKFWRHSEKPCNISYGVHCFWHIYTQGCANRHPKRVWNAWNYVRFEINEAANRYKKIIVMSDFIRQGMMECGIREEQIECNPYFTNKIDFVSDNSDQLIKKILFVGRLISSKGPHIMLKALSGLLSERNDVRLEIIGDCMIRASLVQMVEDMGLNKRVSFKGWLKKEDIDKAIEESYIVIFPSIYPEAFGIAGIEAMMHGKPVVGFNVGGVSTWLKNEVTGFLIEAGDINMMREKTELLLNDREGYDRMSRNARIEALKKFVPSVHINKLMEIYKDNIEK
jgi:glycosyltransferase involved in cell wall biosynthesis